MLDRMLENNVEQRPAGGFMGCDQDIGVHGFVQSAFLKNSRIGVHRSNIQPLFGFFCVVENERDLKVLTALGAVPKDDGKGLNTWVLAVAFDEFIQDRFRAVPLPGIEQTQRRRNVRPDADGIGGGPTTWPTPRPRRIAVEHEAALPS